MMPPTELNSERELLRLLRILAKEFKLDLTTAFTDWLIRLTGPMGQELLVFGYDFGLHPSSSAQIARDKGAASHLLRAAGVSCLEQRVVFRPDWVKYTNQESTYAAALAAFNDFGKNVVCKNNIGTGGTQVYRADSFSAVELALTHIFKVHYACVISSFIEIDHEIRVILIDNHPTAVFAKQRPTVTGDGLSTVATLIAKQLPNMFETNQLSELSRDQLLFIPSPGELRVVNWRHNLGQGSSPEFDIDSGLRDAAVVLSQRAVSTLKLRAASVDIVWTAGKPLVLEVNNGIMVENLTRSGETGRELALATYRALLRSALDN